jgi:CRP/FNR family transcriptional regulator
MSRGDIADFLGLTIETVSRAFTAMRKEGLIALPDKHQVVIADIEALREAAGD